MPSFYMIINQTSGCVRPKVLGPRSGKGLQVPSEQQTTTLGWSSHLIEFSVKFKIWAVKMNCDEGELIIETNTEIWYMIKW